MTIAGHTFTVYQDAFDDPDSDHDGLSDAWEMAYFGNLNRGLRAIRMAMVTVRQESLLSEPSPIIPHLIQLHMSRMLSAMRSSTFTTAPMETVGPIKPTGSV